MSTDLTVHDLSRDKIELIKQTVAKGASDLELELFLHACKRTGLDPLMKQLYAIKRWSAADRRETLTFQTGIDGYRLIADRTGKYAGSTDPQYELNDEGYPAVATVTVHKTLDSGAIGSFTASARWTEYVQRTKEGEPNSMWKKMPFLMLGKCAEALALRKAFPAELSGVYTHEEMMQADNESRLSHPMIQQKHAAQAKIAELRSEGAASVANGEAGASASPVESSSVPAGDAPSDPAEPYRVKMRVAHDRAAVNQIYKSCPNELKSEIYAAYSERLKELKS